MSEKSLVVLVLVLGLFAIAIFAGYASHAERMKALHRDAEDRKVKAEIHELAKQLNTQGEAEPWILVGDAVFDLTTVIHGRSVFDGPVEFHGLVTLCDGAKFDYMPAFARPITDEEFSAWGKGWWQ